MIYLYLKAWRITRRWWEEGSSAWETYQADINRGRYKITSCVVNSSKIQHIVGGKRRNTVSKLLFSRIFQKMAFKGLSCKLNVGHGLWSTDCIILIGQYVITNTMLTNRSRVTFPIMEILKSVITDKMKLTLIMIIKACSSWKPWA